ncbi:amino acid adenylation domain-containing protein [Streptomyces candidus]|uniref:Amino acid adenylation domain-containing protein n=1 Tax=Streptomyces candidus TaxID=67283 RepID=A0A7X0LT40_9ACTN|nr:amino acid adenylation domain-containing protein [Streptomyces candidus]MBB6438616.1 amino acid adenylation domain-containing protein [Streptomyces candidus]GHH45306.1 hypothetical protein GCM10018773_34360 [Streptomyces candidus]
MSPGHLTHVPDQRFDEFLLAAGALTPERPAVVEYAEGTVRTTTFRELQDSAARYAAELDRYGLDIGDRVMIVSDMSAQAVALLLACAARGLPFVPVSPEAPPERRATIAELAEPALCLTAASCDATAAPGATPVGQGSFGPEGIRVPHPPVPGARRRRALAPTDTAYIIFTSGTTGRPKGVVMSHRAVVSFYRGMLAERIVGADDRVASTSPLQFDFSLLDLGLALGSGAALVPVPRPLLRWPTRFLKVLRATGATQVNGVPSIWRQVLRHVPEQLAELPDLRGVLFCGEEFPTSELRHLQRLRPRMRLVNCYGATESMAASFADVPRPLPEETRRLPIGQGHTGAELLLVGEDGTVIEEAGTVGEMYLRSPALFSGYWADPGASAAALVPDPVEPRSGQRVFRTGDLACRGDDGELYFCGRNDSQVQIRGNRVELNEVQRRLLEFPGVTEAAALVVESPGQEPELAAFVVFDEEARPADESDVVAFCLRSMPAYMAPSLMRVTDALPVNQHGKTDHRKLVASLASA